MADVSDSSSVELARQLLEKSDVPLTSIELCRQVMALPGLEPGMAGRLAGTLLSGDPRFVHSGRGVWSLAEVTEPVPVLEIFDHCEFVVIDVETTGMSPPTDRVIEVACVKIAGGAVVDEYSTLVNPGRQVPWIITRLTGITGQMVSSAPSFGSVAERFLDFLGEAVFVAHNAPFDWRFIQSEVRLARARRLVNRTLCTRRLTVKLVPELSRRRLGDLAEFFNLDFDGCRHRALGDARVTARALLILLERAREKGIDDLTALEVFLQPARTRKK
ncbi:MAG: 3'-5' exonuclease [Gemmatimonadota bacterium]|nr:3'-5' exonuclease [Gemmatimonadota bacterium]